MSDHELRAAGEEARAAREEARARSRPRRSSRWAAQSSVRVRDGEIEDLTQATSKGVGVRVIVEGPARASRTRPTSTPARLDALRGPRGGAGRGRRAEQAQRAARRARTCKGRRGRRARCSTRRSRTSPRDWKIKAALEMEKAGKAVDPRITDVRQRGRGRLRVARCTWPRSEGVTRRLLRAPTCTCTRRRWRRENGQLQTSYWVDYKRFLDELDSPGGGGPEAARRAVRMLGAKKVKTPAGAGGLRSADGRVLRGRTSPARRTATRSSRSRRSSRRMLGKQHRAAST